MKNLKNLNRNELKTVLGGAARECLVPMEGGNCPAGHTYCSNPYCCYPPKRPFICFD